LLGAGLAFNNWKNNLREEGIQICVQEINAQTLIDLEAALAHEIAAGETLRAAAIVAEAENELARARLDDSQERISEMAAAMRQQEETDETYRAWSHTPLPDGVAERLRRIDAGSDPHPGNEDGN
jgi:hypothetical protein